MLPFGRDSLRSLASLLGPPVQGATWIGVLLVEAFIVSTLPFFP